MSSGRYAARFILRATQEWAGQYLKEIGGIAQLAKALTPKQQSIQALKAVNRQLNRDSDLLKKSAAFIRNIMQASIKSSRSN